MPVVFVKSAKGIGELLRSQDTLAMLESKATAVAEAAASLSVSGRSTYRTDSQVGKVRARAAVITDSPAAMVAEMREHRLARAIDAAR